MLKCPFRESLAVNKVLRAPLLLLHEMLMAAREFTQEAWKK